MMLLACYDVADDRRRRRIETLLREFGYRLQWSVYLLSVEPIQIDALWREATLVLDQAEDSLRWYRICTKDQSRMLFDGFSEKPEFGGNVVLD